MPTWLEGIAEGMRKAIADLEGWKAVVVALLSGREPAPADQWSQDELLRLAEALFPGPDTPTSSQLWEQLRERGVADAPQTDAAIRKFPGELRQKALKSIQCSLAKRGIPEEMINETINEWLRFMRDLEAEWQEEESDNDDDDE